MEKKEKLTDKYQRKKVEDLLKRKFFIIQSFEIYGGVSGLFDFGPLGCALKTNVEQLWRNHFVLEEDMLEVSCTCLTPEPVLKASGHVDKFEDLMVKDVKNGQCYRADKLLEEHIQKVLNKKRKKMKEAEIKNLEMICAQADSYSQEEMAKLLVDLGVKSPDTGNDISEPTPFNLMFSSQIGCDGDLLMPTACPEKIVAGGIRNPFELPVVFILPFAAAQIGLGFRNEISPRSGLLRVREFTMAEIEHFVDPQDKNHRKFKRISDTCLPLFSQDKQLALEDPITDMTIAEAVEKGVVSNETLAYYMARTYEFLQLCGIAKEAIRFRQHLKTEMAHYAQDCWDAEVETSYGWIEIAGHADRACFDLDCHSQATKTPLVGTRLIKQTVEVPDPAAAEGEESKKTKTEVKNVEEKFAPHVIEPSFGIGRVVYCIFEHCFRARPEAASRTYFEFPALIAPVKTSILPLISNSEELQNHVYELKTRLNKEGVTSKIDNAKVTIGKRYARTDECGIPFAITVDDDTLKDDTVTLREIKSMKQIRIPINELSTTILDLSKNLTTWDAIKEKYPEFTGGKE
eukprot:CAMPEP_0168347122 /NCGR_PEP_ID=MMETSP0213-20121227/18784_1 /TAXON_ID=151035 /ORGANISM="Euplotes harpa, Strain FSP1.4" /LENGTH=572 /DNA_ID=CAMNT_0008356115 /DNA_START=124 /DNA_END=1842 /DNA_ORIENTATION=+